MEIIKIDTLAELKELIDSFKRGYVDQNIIFRGQPDARPEYLLTPSAFRYEKINQLEAVFPVSLHTRKSWITSKRIATLLNAWHPNLIVNGLAPHYLFVFFRLQLYIMQYNYSLAKNAQKYVQSMTDKDKAMINERPPEFWTTEETFNYLVSSAFPHLLNYFSLENGKLLQKAEPFEDLASIDQGYLQHQGTSTTYLDWSRNFLVAIFFALASEEQYENPAIYNVKHMPSKYCAIFTYLQNLYERSPVRIVEGDSSVSNLRLQNQSGVFTEFAKPYQSGVFTEFAKPCAFYYLNGHFPSVEYYARFYKCEYFTLKKFSILRSQENCSYLKELLIDNNITPEFLLPNMDKQEAISV